jgi:type I restriction enzyme, S subunit
MKWSVAPLFKIVRIVGGGTPAKANSAFWSGEIPWVSPKDVVSRDIWETQDHISENAVAESATQLVPAGSVLIVARSGILARFVPIAIARVPVTLNQDMKAFLPTTEALDNQFLAYFLESRSPELLASFVKRGATVHSLDMNKLQQLQVPIPPLLEQRRIVEILDQADALRKKRVEAEAKADRILDALFVKMFGDPATNPKGWQKGQLSSVINETQYGTSARANIEGKGTVVVRMNNIDFLGHLDLQDVKHIVLDAQEVEKYRLEPGDLLFNRTNSRELVGKTGLWRGEIQAVPASYLIRVRVNRKLVFPEYIWAYMNTAFIKQVLFEKARRAIGMANINAQELRALPVVIPDFETQSAFTRLLCDVGCLVEARSRTKEKLDQLFQTVLHRAFSGELTATWREAYMKEIMAEMKEQAKYLAAHSTHSQRDNAALQESLF